MMLIEQKQAGRQDQDRMEQGRQTNRRIAGDA
jgi:hypothetical protein